MPLLFLRAGLSFPEIFKIINDLIAAIPALEASVPLVEQILADVEAGKIPALTPAQLAQVAADEKVIAKLVADVKSLLA